MASPAAAPVGPDTPITIKISIQGTQKKLKLPLSDLVPGTLATKLREFLQIPDSQAVVFERFSDSSASYVNLDPSNLHAYKTLYRAAKAKLKLRLRALPGPSPAQSSTDSGAAALPQTPSNPLAGLNFGSELTLNNMPGPSTVAPTAQPPAPPSQQTPPSTTEVDAKPESHILPPQTSNDDEVLNDFAEKVKDLQKVVSDMFQATVNTGAVANNAEHVALASFGQRMTKDPKPLTHQPRTFVHRISADAPALNSWSVYCNNCEKNMLNEHYHCNVCDGGDYDLCLECMDAGVHCPGDNHWLIKRVFNTNGSIVTSTTETVGPKPKPEPVKEMPGAFTEEKKPDIMPAPTRTCNCCVKVFPEYAFVTCTNCEDYDLCVPCLEDGKHGHHPAHSFAPATGLTVLSHSAEKLCNPGRNVMHAAICDKCDNAINGVRYKCQVCPDWDYCQDCIESAPASHAGHRFAPIYDPIPMHPTRYGNGPTHHGIYCDGPLCKNLRTYVRGIRYKCAVCNDVDFCANCEASPLLEHNRTHPLIKFRSPVRSCSITTEVRDRTVSYHGDGNQRSFIATMTAAAVAKAATTPVRVVADVKPAEGTPKEKIEIKDLLTEMTPETTPESKSVDQQKVAVKNLISLGSSMESNVKSDELQAYFIRDIVADGTSFVPGQTFIQGWILKNPGPYEWPAGCSVRYVGGDNMLNVDDSRPSAECDVSKAVETNVLRHPVKIGEEFSFHVQMKAPKRQGCAISYWRLKAPDGTPFGHRLWCHINVTANPVAINSASAANCPHHSWMKPSSSTEDKPYEYHSPDFSANRKFEREQAIRRLRAYRRRDMDCSRAYTRSQPADIPKEDLKSLNEQHAAHIEEMLRERVRNLKISSPFESSSSQQPKEEPAAETTTEIKKEVEESKSLIPELITPAPPVAVEQVPTNAAETVSVPAIAEPLAEVKDEPVAEPEVKDEDDIFDDAESINLSEDDESAFHTDDEYDILNASDEEEETKA